jgi:signal transduction histidine kinase
MMTARASTSTPHASAPRRGASLGMLSMEERVSLAGGRLAIESTPGHGTTIRARIPLIREDAR